MYKLDTPLKPSKAESSRANTKQSLISNEDLMAVLIFFKAEVVSSSKGLSE